MAITSAGNVGIGTTAPTTSLEIQHATNPKIFLKQVPLIYQLYSVLKPNEIFVYGVSTEHNETQPLPSIPYKFMSTYSDEDFNTDIFLSSENYFS